MRNNCLARRAGTDATTPAAGLIISNQRLYDVKLAALLNKDATAAPVATTTFGATRIRLIVRNVNPASITGVNCCHRAGAVAARDTQTAAFGVIGNIAGNRTASHFAVVIFIIKTSVDATASLIGIVGRNEAAR